MAPSDHRGIVVRQRDPDSGSDPVQYPGLIASLDKQAEPYGKSGVDRLITH
jgi:hypothetical protein